VRWKRRMKNVRSWTARCSGDGAAATAIKSHDDFRAINYIFSSQGRRHRALQQPLKPESPEIFTARCTIVQSAILRSHVVCLSVCDVGGSGPHRLKIMKLIARTISQTSLLFVAQRYSSHSKGNMEKFWGRLEVEWEKVACWSTKAAISVKRVKIEESYYRGPTGSHQRSFK